MATFFVLAPSLISGSIWLLASYKARQKQRLGLQFNVEADGIRPKRINRIKNDRLHLKTYD